MTSMKSGLEFDRKLKALIAIIRNVSFEERIDKYREITLYSKSEVEEGWLMRNPFLKRFT